MVRILVRGAAIPCYWLFLLRHHDFLMIQPLLTSMLSFSTTRSAPRPNSPAALLRSRPGARRAYPLCASHHQAPHAGRLNITAQRAIATGPSSPADTDAATVIAPSATPAHQEPRR